MEKRICPNCEGFLEEIEVPNKYGIIIRIDRCPSGCGFWFDQFELYQIGFKESKKIIAESPLRVSEEREDLLCPVCSIPMKRMKIDYFSDKIIFNYCQGCSGIWIDRDKLLIYKKMQEERARRAFENFERDANYLSSGLVNEKNILDKLLDSLLNLF